MRIGIKDVDRFFWVLVSVVVIISCIIGWVSGERTYKRVMATEYTQEDIERAAELMLEMDPIDKIKKAPEGAKQKRTLDKPIITNKRKEGKK